MLFSSLSTIRAAPAIPLERLTPPLLQGKFWGPRDPHCWPGSGLLCRDADWLCLDTERAADFDFLAGKRDSSGGFFIGPRANMVGPSTGGPSGSSDCSTARRSAVVDGSRLVPDQHQRSVDRSLFALRGSVSRKTCSTACAGCSSLWCLASCLPRWQLHSWMLLPSCHRLGPKLLATRARTILD